MAWGWKRRGGEGRGRGVQRSHMDSRTTIQLCKLKKTFVKRSKDTADSTHRGLGIKSLVAQVCDSVQVLPARCHHQTDCLKKRHVCTDNKDVRRGPSLRFIHKGVRATVRVGRKQAKCEHVRQNKVQNRRKKHVYKSAKKNKNKTRSNMVLHESPACSENKKGSRTTRRGGGGGGLVKSKSVISYELLFFFFLVQQKSFDAELRTEIGAKGCCQIEETSHKHKGDARERENNNKQQPGTD